MFSETEEKELRELVEKGRKAKIASEFVQDFLTRERANVFFFLETKEIQNPEKLLEPVIYLRLMRRFESEIKLCIEQGDIAQKELNENGSE